MVRKHASIKEKAERALVIERVLDAPRELVFKAWSESKRLRRWWGPKGFTIPFCKVDFRPGGVFNKCMRSHEGHDIWSQGIFREISEPERIVFTDFFVDAEGNPVSPTHYGMSKEWPQETVITVTLEELEGKTRLTLHHDVASAPTLERDMCRRGWGEFLDKLAEYLSVEHPGSSRKETETTGTGTIPQETPGSTEPLPEHLWLRQLIGEWTIEGEMAGEPGKPPAKYKGTESVRSLGGLWILAEGQGETTGCGPSTTLLTLGYDPQEKGYVGTFIGSMMTHLWAYTGALDAAGKTLTLNTEGPSFITEGKIDKFRDAIEVKSRDHRVLTSHRLGDDGEWHEFMTLDYRRKK